jgi:hypothetical protein
MGYRQTRPRTACAAALAAVLALSAALAAAADAGTAMQDAATQRQNERTDRTNRAATVPDEASAAQAHPAAGPAAPPAADTRTSPAPLSYGPVLTPRNGQNGPSGQHLQGARKDPAEVSDETDTPARPTGPAAGRTPSQPSAQPASGAASGPAPAPAQGPGSSARESRSSNPQLTDRQREEGRRRAARRHPAYQGEGPMAPRPLRAGERPPAFVAEPVPTPLPAPQPVVPSSNVVRACQGIACTDAAGNTFNGSGSGNAGVGSGGRMCARTGTTVQCF